MSEMEQFFHPMVCQQCGSSKIVAELAIAKAYYHATEGWPDASLIVLRCNDCHARTLTGLGVFKNEREESTFEVAQRLRDITDDLIACKDMNVPLLTNINGYTGMVLEVPK